MASEIRVNKINNRAGLGTVEYTPTGIIVSGIVTAYEFDGNFDTTPGIVITGIGTAQSLDVDDFVDVGNIIKLGNAGVVTATTFSTANVDVTTDKIVVGTGVTIEANQVATGQATFTGIVTASAFKLSDGSNVGGVESDSRLNTVGGTLSGADIVIGGNSGSSGNDNTLFGYSAGRFIALGDGNSCFGVTAGRNIGAGLWNTFIGGQAGRNMSSSYNTCVGYQASYMNNAQGYTVAFGYQAGYNATNSGRLTAIGYQAGKAHTGGNGNTYLGYQAGHLNTAGDRNVVIGDLTVSGSSDYNRVTVIGAGAAGGFGSNANDNTVIGYNAGGSTLTGTNNIIIGSGANLSGNVSNEITLGNANINHLRVPGIGVSFSEGGGVVTGIMTASSFKLLDGSTVGFSPDAQNNLFAGTDAGASLNSSSNNNVLFGQDAGDSITSGYENVCIGLRAGQAITDTRRNTCVGPDAGRNFSAGDSTFIGWYAGASASSNGNICVGHNAGVEANGGDTAVGYSCGPTGSYSGTQNVCYGRTAGNGLRQNASDNTIIGPGAGRNAATGQVNIEGNYNIILGAEASLSSTTVGNECVIGAVYGQSKAITHFRIPGIGVTFATNGNHISGITTFSNDIRLPDAVASNNYSSLYLGDGNDIRLFHNGQNSFLQHKLGTPANSGNFYIDSYATTYMRTSDGSSGVENAIVMNSNSSVDVYHSGTKKLETSSTGINVTGKVVASGEIEAAQDYPNIRPTLDFNFAATKKLDSRIKYTRTGLASFINEFGLVEKVNANVPRFDHDPVTRKCKGLLIEEERTNKINYSDAPGPSSPNLGGNPQTNGGTNNITLPTGEKGSVREYLANASGGGARWGGYSASSNSIPHTGSMWIRTVSGTGSAILDVNDGGGKTVSLTTEWQRVTTTHTSNNTYEFFDLYFGTPVAVYIWGVQIEEGEYMTSYIPTFATARTRGADIAVIDGQNFIDFYNPIESSVLAVGTLDRPASAQGQLNIFHIGDSNEDGHGVFRENGTKDVWYHIRNNNSTPSGGNLNPSGFGDWDEDEEARIAVAFKDGDQAISVNGGNQITATVTSSYPTADITKMWIGSHGNGSYFQGTISRIAYYPKLLTDSQLNTLTS